jgi:hypothetical protein
MKINEDVLRSLTVKLDEVASPPPRSRPPPLQPQSYVRAAAAPPVEG